MGESGADEIIAKLLRTAKRLVAAIDDEAAPHVRKIHHESPHAIRAGLSGATHEDRRLATELDRLGPAARSTAAHQDRGTTAEHLTPGEIVAHVARTGWATDPITLYTHRTDKGRLIPPRTLSEGAVTAPPPVAQLLRSRAGLTRLFQKNIEQGVRLDLLEPLAPINPHYNCHGYTFSRHGEAGWLGGRWVDDILEDNGFLKVTDIGAATPGDVVVYRDADSVVTHSGVVTDLASGEVYVDSKQGPLSVVRHRIHEVTGMYGSHVALYRTERPDGRFLTSIENSGQPAPPWPPAPSPHDPADQ
ncbi:hypothetical protein [Nocardia gamkensis]|uniref:hypothetical protein n=1 Tax=Nocardia gamkensis TaxID=352869 RepID=UPI0037C7895E